MGGAAMGEMNVPACPFHPFSADYLADPYPTFTAVREEAPAFYSDELDMWVVTRYHDASMVMSDTVLFSASNSQDPLLPFSPEAGSVLAEGFGYMPVMTNLDPPEHARIRRHNMTAFSARRVADMEPAIRHLTTGLLDDLLTEERFDWVAGLAYPLPISVIFELVGFPHDDADQVKGWAGDRLTIMFGHPDETEQLRVAQNMAALWHYCTEHVQRRKVDRTDDFTSALLDIHDADPDAISMVEITSVIMGLGIAGHETTTNLLANAMRLLLEHRQQWNEICGDASLIPNAVEEALRVDSSVNAWRRLAKVDVDLGEGVVIPEGAKVLVLLGSGNRDGAAFDDPDRFDIHRDQARRHLSFGKGIHHCLGAPLARLEARIVLEEITRRAPDIQLDDQQLDYPPIISFRGPRRLWLTRNTETHA
ncbi:MAG: cytochrome P450 [Acidimicrobiales bacterium]